MGKELIDPGVYQYSLDSLEEAKRDADASSQTEVTYVSIVNYEYVGPMNEHKRRSVFYRRYEIAHTAYPKGRREQ